MGKAYLDGVVLDADLKGETILEVVAEVEKSFVEEGKIIVAIDVDGESLQDFSDENGELLLYDPNSDLHIISRPLHSILIESIDQFVEYLRRLVPGMKQIADQYTAGNYEEANELYTDAIEGIRVMTEMLQGLFQSNALDFTAPDFEGKSLLEMMDVMKDVIQRLVESQTSNDFEAMAKILEKDLASILGSWLSALPIVRGQLVEM